MGKRLATPDADVIRVTINGQKQSPILFVEDDVGVRETSQDGLSFTGATVHTALSGQEAAVFSRRTTWTWSSPIVRRLMGTATGCLPGSVPRRGTKTPRSSSGQPTRKTKAWKLAQGRGPTAISPSLSTPANSPPRSRVTWIPARAALIGHPLATVFLAPPIL